MNIIFAIGGMIVLAGIVYMTVAYYKTAAELREVTKKYRAEKELNDSLWKALMAHDDGEEIKFGDF